MITPLFVGILLCYSFPKIKLKSESQLTQFGTLFNELKQDKGLLTIFYYVFHLTRRLQFILTQVILDNSELAQNIINASFGYLMLGYMIFFRPFKDTLTQISFMATEVLFSCIFTCLTIFSLSDEWMSERMYRNVAILSVIVCTGVQFCITLVQLIQTLKRIYSDHLVFQNRRASQRINSRTVHNRSIIDRS